MLNKYKDDAVRSNLNLIRFESFFLAICVLLIMWLWLLLPNIFDMSKESKFNFVENSELLILAIIVISHIIIGLYVGYLIKLNNEDLFANKNLIIGILIFCVISYIIIMGTPINILLIIYLFLVIDLRKVLILFGKLQADINK